MSEKNILSKSTWARKKPEQHSPPVLSFVEIMSETLAEDLQKKELTDFDNEQTALENSLRDLDTFPDEDDCSRDHELALKLSEDPDISADMQMALELQRQFDREAEIDSQQLEQQPTGVQNSKKGTTITLGLDPFQYKKMEDELQQERSDNEEEEREKAIEEFYTVKEKFPPCGFKRNEQGEIVTKHDKESGQKKNCQNMLLFPMEFNTGDILGKRISSRIYNDLQLHAKEEKRRLARLKDKEQIATSDASVDVKTRLILLDWINNGLLDSVEGVIAVGKESTVLNGLCKSSEVGTSSEVGPLTRFAVKCHKQVLNAFRNRSDYVTEDFKYRNARKILKYWANKEYINLNRLYKAGVPCPKPIKFKKHVLLMTLIQDESGRPAPKLKNYLFSEEDEKLKVFNQVKEIMIQMYACQLIHADLSEYNLLFADGKIYVIDVAQSVDLSHPRGLHFLQRDIENVLRFFEKNATEGLPTAHSLFAEITGIKVDEERDLLTQIEAFNEQHLNMNLSKFRKNPDHYTLVLMDKELEDMEFNDDSDSDKE